MRTIDLTLLLPLALMGCATAQAESAFAPVFIDARTEARLGPFPYDRTVTANALVALEKLGAKGVVMKFFLDQPKGAGDDALANAMTKLPVVLQARCDDTEAKPNLLDARFSTAVTSQMVFGATCKSGWIPLPMLQKPAADVCFIDQPAVDIVPLLERYQDRAVKSLYGCALAMAGKAMPAADRSGSLKVDLRKSPRYEVISLLDVLDGKVDLARIAGKVVVLGYEGKLAAMFDTPIGRLSAHRGFMANLLALEAGAIALK